MVHTRAEIEKVVMNCAKIAEKATEGWGPTARARAVGRIMVALIPIALQTTNVNQTFLEEPEK